MIDVIDIKYFKQAVNGPYNESKVDIAAKCPICGDSKYKTNVKRLHLYERSGVTLVHCFNGDCNLNTQTSLGNFLKIYNPELYFNYKQEKFKNILYEKKEPEFNFDYKMNIKDIKDIKTKDMPQENIEIKTFDILNFLSNKDADLNPITNYLINRGFNADSLKMLNYYVGKTNFTFNGRYFKIKDYLVIPFIFNNKVYGFYSRSIIEKNFINFSANPSLNIWNLFNVDLEKPVLIFEAILDAVSFSQIYNFKNVVALNTNNISSEVLKLIKKPVFCFDNDNAGITKMIDYTKFENAKFLIYPDIKYKDFNEMLLNNFKMDLKFEKGLKAKIELKKIL